MFILLKNYASAGASKGENLELISMAFKVRLGYRILLNSAYFTEGNKCFGNLPDATLFMWILIFWNIIFAVCIYISKIFSSACKKILFLRASEIVECVMFAGSDSAGPRRQDLQTGADTATSASDLLWGGLVRLQQTEHCILPAKSEVLSARFSRMFSCC